MPNMGEGLSLDGTCRSIATSTNILRECWSRFSQHTQHTHRTQRAIAGASKAALRNAASLTDTFCTTARETTPYRIAENGERDEKYHMTYDTRSCPKGQLTSFDTIRYKKIYR